MLRQPFFKTKRKGKQSIDQGQAPFTTAACLHLSPQPPWQACPFPCWSADHCKCALKWWSFPVIYLLRNYHGKVSLLAEERCPANENIFTNIIHLLKKNPAGYFCIPLCDCALDDCLVCLMIEPAQAVYNYNFSFAGILVTASKSSDNSYNYSTVTVVLLTECVKLLASTVLYLKKWVFLLFAFFFFLVYQNANILQAVQSMSILLNGDRWVNEQSDI